MRIVIASDQLSTLVAGVSRCCELWRRSVW